MKTAVAHLNNALWLSKIGMWQAIEIVVSWMVYFVIQPLTDTNVTATFAVILAVLILGPIGAPLLVVLIALAATIFSFFYTLPGTPTIVLAFIAIIPMYLGLAAALASTRIEKNAEYGISKTVIVFSYTAEFILISAALILTSH